MSGKVRFIFVVDIYNEGVDIPEVNTVLFFFANCRKPNHTDCKEMRSGIVDPVFETKIDGTELLFPLFFQTANLVSLCCFFQCAVLEPEFDGKAEFKALEHFL